MPVGNVFRKKKGPSMLRRIVSVTIVLTCVVVLAGCGSGMFGTWGELGEETSAGPYRFQPPKRFKLDNTQSGGMAGESKVMFRGPAFGKSEPGIVFSYGPHHQSFSGQAPNWNEGVRRGLMGLKGKCRNFTHSTGAPTDINGLPGVRVQFGGDFSHKGETRAMKGTGYLLIDDRNLLFAIGMDFGPNCASSIPKFDKSLRTIKRPGAVASFGSGSGSGSGSYASNGGPSSQSGFSPGSSGPRSPGYPGAGAHSGGSSDSSGYPDSGMSGGSSDYPDSGMSGGSSDYPDSGMSGGPSGYPDSGMSSDSSGYPDSGMSGGPGGYPGGMSGRPGRYPGGMSGRPGGYPGGRPGGMSGRPGFPSGGMSGSTSGYPGMNSGSGSTVKPVDPEELRRRAEEARRAAELAQVAADINSPQYYDANLELLQIGTDAQKSAVLTRLEKADRDDISDAGMRKELARGLRDVAQDTKLGLSTRRDAIPLLVEWTSNYSVPILIGLLEDKQRLIQMDALKHLTELHDERAIVPVTELFVKSALMRDKAADCLRTFGPVAEDEVLKVTPTDIQITRATIQLLGDIGTRKSLEPLKAVRKFPVYKMVRKDLTEAEASIRKRMED